MSIPDIARVLGISSQAVQQHERQAIRALWRIGRKLNGGSRRGRGFLSLNSGRCKMKQLREIIGYIEKKKAVN